MKRLDIVLGLSAATILGVWSWRTWPDPVTAIGVTILVAPLYVAAVHVMSRQDADRQWRQDMHDWAEGVEGQFGRASGEQLVTVDGGPEDVRTSPALDVAGEAARRVLDEDAGPATVTTSAFVEAYLVEKREQWARDNAERAKKPLSPAPKTE